MKAGDTVRQHESKFLGKREQPDLPASGVLVSDAVTTLIQKRRRTSQVPDCKPNISQLRAEEKQAIGKVVREHKADLVPFKEVMSAALANAEAYSFTRLKGSRDFTDGYLLNTRKFAGG